MASVLVNTLLHIWFPACKYCCGSSSVLSLVHIQRPFNCKNFHELLRIVEQATKEEKWETSYVAIVARFFSDFADITERDGYVVEKHVCTSSVLHESMV